MKDIRFRNASFKSIHLTDVTEFRPLHEDGLPTIDCRPRAGNGVVQTRCLEATEAFMRKFSFENNPMVCVYSYIDYYSGAMIQIFEFCCSMLVLCLQHQIHGMLASAGIKTVIPEPRDIPMKTTLRSFEDIYALNVLRVSTFSKKEVELGMQLFAGSNMTAAEAIISRYVAEPGWDPASAECKKAECTVAVHQENTLFCDHPDVCAGVVATLQWDFFLSRRLYVIGVCLFFVTVFMMTYLES